MIFRLSEATCWLLTFRGKTAVIIRALYGLKSAEAAFRSHLARCMESLGYQSCNADPDLWLKLEIRPKDGLQCYSYLLCFVDGILCIYHNVDTILEWLHKSFPLKPWFDKSDMYLGMTLRKTRLHNEVWAWAMSPVKYVWEASRNFAVHLAANYGCRFRLPKKAENPFKKGYDPETNTSPDLDLYAVSYYLTIIDVLRWIIELGKINIITKVPLLSSHVALPERDI